MHAIPILTLFLWSVLLAACAPSDSDGSGGQEQGLFVVTAGSVEVNEAGLGNLKVTLGDVDSRAMWFTDRPDRLADVVPVGDLIAAWSELGFADLPPNAGLVISDSQDDATLIMTVLDPVWSSTEQSLQMTGRPLAAEDLPGDHFLAAHVDRVVEELPSSVEHVALFIDPAPIPPEFESMPASCVAVPHVGGPADSLGGEACVPVAQLPDFGSGGAVPGPLPRPDGTSPPSRVDEQGVDRPSDSVVGPSMSVDVDG